MKRITLIGALLLASSACQATDIASTPWHATQQKQLNGLPDLPAQAQRLLGTMLPNADVVPPAVGEARFVDLDQDGNLELVSTVDYSGRGFFNNIVVVRQQQGHFSWTALGNNGRSIEDLPSHLVDANGDGVPELVLEQFMDRYEGALRVPVETVIYRWGPAGFRDASDAFPEYYRSRVVPKLEEQLAKASSKGSSKATSSVAHEDDDVFMLKAELARARQRGRVK
jgi:hypothetical protein